jgi:hypothetical protein
MIGLIDHKFCNQQKINHRREKMKFSKNRGRPKRTFAIGKDKGTAELREKRKSGITTEPLDLCAERGLINTKQHNAGIRLRWLYTLKLGAPCISAYCADNVVGRSCKYEDIFWLKQRQSEYTHIIQELEKNKARRIVMDICIFNRMPDFLYKIPNKINIRSLHNYKDLEVFVMGLDVIANMLNNKNRILFDQRGRSWI